MWIQGLSVPSLVMRDSSHQFVSVIPAVLLVLSVTMSSPILALQFIFGTPLPEIPTDLFECPDAPSILLRSPNETIDTGVFDMQQRNFSSVTVLSRRSGDVWVEKGDAVDGRNKVGRSMARFARSSNSTSC